METLIGRGLLAEVPKALDGVRKVLIVCPEALATTADAISESLKGQGFETYVANVPNSEDAKRIEVASFCWQIMGQADFQRNDAVIGVGGGSTTDLSGFVAATWLRGIRSVLIPTTLLGMVDAALGGKTGINTSEGKNLVGSFHLPHQVLIDLDTLETLPKNELVAGMAEVIKYGFIRDPEMLSLIENSTEESLDFRSSVFEELIRRSVQIKEYVTNRDFRESGEREFLNYGHTLGHAIEHAERYKWRHGAAISIGMVFAAELSLLLGKLSEAEVERHRSIFMKLGLPVSYRGDRWDQLLATMRKDKKGRGGMLRFIVLDELGKPTVANAPTDELLFTAFQAIVE